MSRQNVDVVRTGFEAFKRGDLEQAFSMLSAEVSWEGVPGVEPCRTRDEVEATIRLNYDAGSPTEAEEFIDAGDKVVVAFRVTGEVFQPYQGREHIYAVLTLRAGKVSHMHDYLDRTEALIAAGLTE